MKIMHVSLCSPFNEGWSYQENIIPKYNKLDGNDVVILTTRYTDNKESNGFDMVSSGEYYYDDIKIRRLDEKKWIPSKLNLKIRVFEGLYKTISMENPDLIFFHGIQSFEMLTIKRYLKRNPNCKWVVDNHGSYYNSGKNWLSRTLLHKILYRIINYCCKSRVDHYFAITPECKKFMIEMYGISEKKISYLFLGYDPELIEEIESQNTRCSLRKKYGFKQDEVVLITGGKLNKGKKIIETIELFSKIKSANSKLIIFGTVSKDIEEQFTEEIKKNKNIIFFGWQDQNNINELLLLSDIGIFLGSQSALWQQSIGANLPLILSEQENAFYLDFNGNVLFLDRENSNELEIKLENLVNNPDKISKMRDICIKKAKKEFSYKTISRKAILKHE